MTAWRLLRGWTDAELAERLARSAHLTRNFPDPPDRLTPEHGWGFHASEAVMAREGPGPPAPGGLFFRAWELVSSYAFSDPRIVVAHFDAAAPLEAREMLLEIRVLGLHFLTPVRVGAVRADADDRETVRGFRYDTLDGHIERGAEWFLLTKDHESGEVRFRIRAGWKRGQVPWWARAGFRLLVRRYQRAWHRLAHLRLRKMLGSHDLPRVPRGRRLVHEGRAISVPVAAALASEAPPEEVLAEADVPEPAGRPAGGRQG